MMDSLKMVSVIIPIYNVENFVEKCIESILFQTIQNLEIILVDDGSSDGSGDICDVYAKKDARIKVIHKKNGGVSSARNMGISNATGEYICFVDGDDFVANDYIEYLLRLINMHDADIALTSSFYSNYNEKQTHNLTEELWNSEDAVEAILCNRILIGCNNKLFKSTLIKRKINFIESLPIGEGFNFNVEVFQMAQKSVVGNKKIYYYIKDNPNSVMTKFNIHKYEKGLYAIELLKENLTIKSHRINLAWEYARWRTSSDFYDMVVLSKAEKAYPEFYKKCYLETKGNALIAFKVPTSRKDKIRAIVLKIYPRIIPFIMKIRKKIYLKHN